MQLYEFIQRKQQELEQSGKYKNVFSLYSVEAVMLSKNSVAERFMVRKTPLEQTGREIDLSTLPEIPSLPFIENGTKLVFEVVEKRKRKPSYVEFYFLWD